MPHVIVKMYAGRSEEAKWRLADAIARDVAEIAGSKSSSVSVAIEDYNPDEWAEAVDRPGTTPLRSESTEGHMSSAMKR